SRDPRSRGRAPRRGGQAARKRRKYGAWSAPREWSYEPASEPDYRRRGGRRNRDRRLRRAVFDEAGRPARRFRDDPGREGVDAEPARQGRAGEFLVDLVRDLRRGDAEDRRNVQEVPRPRLRDR